MRRQSDETNYFRMTVKKSCGKKMELNSKFLILLGFFLLLFVLIDVNYSQTLRIILVFFFLTLSRVFTHKSQLLNCGDDRRKKLIEPSVN